jgi:hypothetical protein
MSQKCLFRRPSSSRTATGFHLRRKSYGFRGWPGRVGKEAFSFLVLLLALVFAGEHLVANRFYDRESQKL